MAENRYRPYTTTDVGNMRPGLDPLGTPTEDVWNSFGIEDPNDHQMQVLGLLNQTIMDVRKAIKEGALKDNVQNAEIRSLFSEEPDDDHQLIEPTLEQKLVLARLTTTINTKLREHVQLAHRAKANNRPAKGLGRYSKQNQIAGEQSALSDELARAELARRIYVTNQRRSRLYP